mmetsp:Transcript_28214/g.39247  ORF Transcript_28214/g.39247 Transcript_28214/m.39247 type:complete len:263 (+) Transcript_28214:37-825(+)
MLSKHQYSAWRTLVPGYMKGFNPRFLAPRECARLQGFPECFRMPNKGKRQNPYCALFGNAVSPPIVTAIGGAVVHAFALSTSGVVPNWTFERMKIELEEEASLSSNMSDTDDVKVLNHIEIFTLIQVFKLALDFQERKQDKECRSKFEEKFSRLLKAINLDKEKSRDPENPSAIFRLPGIFSESWSNEKFGLNFKVPSSIDRICYRYKAFGFCPWGLKCRFLHSATNDNGDTCGGLEKIPISLRECTRALKLVCAYLHKHDG